MAKKKKTVGETAVDLASKADNKHTVVDQMQENLTDYEKNVRDCAQRGLQEHNSDFFVVVLTKKEKLFPNVFRNFFLHRKSCPTPEYDQTVYHYIHKLDALKYLWTVPDKETCKVYLENAAFIPFDEKKLLQFIMDFADGTLDRLSRTLNKEAGTGQYLENKIILENPYAKS